MNRDDLYLMYVTQRASADDIASIFGVSTRTVYHRLKAFGISRKEGSNLEEFKQWAIVELMGHIKVAGLVTEEERFGVKMGRIDIYQDAESDKYITQYFNGSAVYRITPTTKEIACSVNKPPAPVSQWELKLPAITQREENDPVDLEEECYGF